MSVTSCAFGTRLRAAKLLIEVAVVMRNLLDGGLWPMDPIHEIRVDARPETNVGILRESGNIESTLAFRDACNKLIHAESLSFGTESVTGKLAHLDGTVKVHGTKGRHSWIAEIQLSDFIRMAVRQL